MPHWNGEHAQTDLDPARYGNKAARLFEARRLGLPVPEFVAIPLERLAQQPDRAFAVYLEELCSELNAASYVVRSSGVAEDSGEHSLAGQALSLIHVAPGAVADAVRRVAASRPNTAVIVQRQVEPDYAGVLFTHDPRGGGEQFSLSYTKGLADRLLSGHEEGDTLLWSRWQSAPHTHFNMAALMDIVRRLQLHYGAPLDIEWAAKDDAVFLLQVRPITALGALDPAAVAASEQSEAQRACRRPLTAGVFAEISGALTPVSAQLLADIYSPAGALGDVYRAVGFHIANSGRWFALHAGRAYLDVKAVEQSLFPAGEAALTVDPLTGSLLPAKAAKASLLRSVKNAVRSVKRAWKDRSLRDSYPECTAALNAENRARLQNHKASFAAADPGALGGLLERVWKDFTTNTMYAALLPGFLLNSVAAELERLLGREKLLDAISAAPASPMTLALHQWKNGTLTRDGLLEAVGNRADNEYELANPRWHELPERLTASGGNAVERTAPQPALHGLGTLKATQCRELLDAHQRLQKGREEAKHHAADWLDLLRKILLRIGETRNLGNDIFFLFPEEIACGAGDFSALIALRKRRHELLKEYAPPMIVGLESARDPASAAQLAGLALSAGVVTGTLFFADTPECLPPPGAILCVPNADPAWAVAMTSAAGFLCERGTLLCHCAVMAREIGIPAVAGIPRSRLKNGSTVRLDAYAGTVTVVAQ